MVQDLEVKATALIIHCSDYIHYIEFKSDMFKKCAIVDFFYLYSF